MVVATIICEKICELCLRLCVEGLGGRNGFCTFLTAKSHSRRCSMRWPRCQAVIALAVLAACPFVGSGNQARGEYVSIQSLGRPVAIGLGADPFHNSDDDLWHERAPARCSGASLLAAPNPDEPGRQPSDAPFVTPRAHAEPPSDSMAPPQRLGSGGPSTQPPDFLKRPHVPRDESASRLVPGRLPAYISVCRPGYFRPPR
jgi:hypothetical protein